MEILGGLIQLDEKNTLPVPWHNRPALGLETHTGVRIGIVKPPERTSRPPDIIVTPLRLEFEDDNVSLEVDARERPGALFDVLEAVEHDFNIALLESVTTDARSRHHITFVLEPPGEARLAESTVKKRARKQAYKDDIDKLISRLKQKKLKVGEPQYHFSENLDFVFTKTFYDFHVDYGKIGCAEVFNEIRDRYSRFGGDYDFSRVVVSSTPSGRFIRYVFPKKGAFQATIRHVDAKSALASISRSIRALHYNILLSRLSRSGHQLVNADRRSVFVAVCEPAPKKILKISGDADAEAYRQMVSSELTAEFDKDIRGLFDVRLQRVSLGGTIDGSAYPTSAKRGLKTIRAPRDIQDELSKLCEFGLRRRKIFLSTTDPEYMIPEGSHLRQTILDAIKKAGASVLDGYKEPYHLDRPVQLHARLWLADAAIFLAFNDKGEARWGDGQRTEFGEFYLRKFAAVADRMMTSVVENFLIPRQVMITFKDVGSATTIRRGTSLLENDIIEQIHRWFPDLAPKSKKETD